MFRFLSLLRVMMLAALLSTGSMAHAAEDLECSAPASMVDHVDGDQQDSAPDGTGKATQHQHGCHGHHVANPAGPQAEPAALMGADEPFARPTPDHPGDSPDSALRPPIA